MPHAHEPLAYHAMPAHDAMRIFGVTTDGLRTPNVAASRAQHGTNALFAPPRDGVVRIALRQLTGPLMLVLFVALVASVLLRDRVDALLIGFVIALHAVLGFAQEYRADRAFAALASYLPRRARVRRDGVVQDVAANDVVVGDMLVLRAGDHVVADARIVHATMCEALESALTGESVAVAKRNDVLAVDVTLADRTNMLFAGTSLTSGTAEAVVVAVGERTAFGAIVASTGRSMETRTPLQEQLARFSRGLVFVILGAIAVVFVWGIAKGFTVMSLLPLCLALAVAAVPEGLLVALTVILARGMHRMATRKALVRNLLAAETLGSVSVLAVDKTGTLTMGDMVATDVQPIDDDIETLLSTLALAVSVTTELREGKETVVGTQTELAVHALLVARHVTRPSGVRALGSVPFDARHKFSAYAYAVNGNNVLVGFGAPDVLLPRVDCSDVERGRFAATMESMSRRGLRVLLVVRREDNVPAALTIDDVRDVRVVGFLGLEDPVRPQAAAMIATCRSAGIRTVMVTGDHPGTASAVAIAVGIPVSPHTLMTGIELARLDDVTLRARIGDIAVFARIRPEDKLRIVRALQAGGATVAMTGDGVNDVPALRAADVGIAVGSGTDVAKEAADLVLLDNDVATIVAAIREGRGMYDNIRKVIAYLVTGSFSEVALALAAIVFGLPLPLLPIHILWINVLTDGFPSLALAAEPPESDVMRAPPRPRRVPLVPRDMLVFMCGAAIVIDGVLVAMLFDLAQHGASVTVLQSFLFLALGLSSMLFILTVRSLRRPFIFAGLTKNPALLLALPLSFALLLFPFLHPMLRNAFGLTDAVLAFLPPLFALAFVQVALIASMKVLVSRAILAPVWTSPEPNTFKTLS